MRRFLLPFLLSLACALPVLGADTPYDLTFIDMLFLWAYVCIAATLVTNVIAKRRFRQDEELGLRFDRRGRIAYPFACIGGVALIALGHWML